MRPESDVINECEDLSAIMNELIIYQSKIQEKPCCRLQVDISLIGKLLHGQFAL